MATRKTSRRTASRTSTTRRTTGGPARRPGRTSRRGGATGSRRRRPGLPTTIGTALGTLVVTTLLDLSWPARIGIIALVLVVGLAYVLWKHRAGIAAGTEQPEQASGEGAAEADLDADSADAAAGGPSGSRAPEHGDGGRVTGP